MPDLVHASQLEKANGRLWSVEAITNQFLGPPLGSLLLLGAFALPFFLDAGSFFAAAALVALIPGSFRTTRDPTASPTSFRADLREGVRWLMGHSLLRPMAIILGLMNAASMVSMATFVLYAQEVLEVGPLLFSILTFGLAIGGLIGGNVASFASRRFGSGTCLALVLLVSGLGAAVIGLASSWPVVMIVLTIWGLVGILWNVITVSLRQTIIPPHLLGRVNSVYRFFAWGMMPVGAALGGITVAVVSTFADRDWALRATWLVNAAIHFGLFAFGRAKLTTAKIESARAAGVQATPTAS
jgi:predicted MFS family arabinose efflux permease